MPAMTLLEKKLQSLTSSAWIVSIAPNLPHVDRYIRTGDAASLKKIKKEKDFDPWSDDVSGAITRPDRWTDQDRRALAVLLAAGRDERALAWLNRILGTEASTEDFQSTLVTELTSLGVSPARIRALTLQNIKTLAKGKTPTSSGRYLLALPDKELAEALDDLEECLSPEQLGFWIAQAPDRILKLAPRVFSKAEAHDAPPLARTLLKGLGQRAEPFVGSLFKACDSPDAKFHLGEALCEFFKPKYRDEMLRTGRQALKIPKSKSPWNEGIPRWLVTEFKDEVLQDLTDYIRSGAVGWTAAEDVLDSAAEALGPKAAPVVLAGMENQELYLHALGCLIDLQDPAHRDLIRKELKLHLAGNEGPKILKFIGLAEKTKDPVVAEDLWLLMSHKSAPVRSAAARALGKMGPANLPKARTLLAEKKADTRISAVTLLSSLNTPEALKALEDRLDVEEDDDVRDAILRAVAASWAASGRKITRADIDARIAKAIPKIKGYPAAWLKEGSLPNVKDTDGKPLAPDAVRYLLFRQSRAKEIQPDIEAKPLFDLIDRKSSGEFALQIYKGFIAAGAAAGDRWALTVAGLLGDDRLVPLISRQIREWAETSRGKMAEYAVHALALLGTDQALLAVDAIAIRYRTKLKNIGKAAVEAFAAAAEAKGLTPDELGDQVVPWLGFEKGKPRIIDAGKQKIRVALGLDFKLQYQDAATGKRIASLPKSLPAETLQEYKELATSLREIVKAQNLSLENLMVRQRRWPVGRWKEMFLGHPLLIPFAVKLVWAAYEDSGRLTASFRALEDLSLTDSSDNAYSLMSTGTVGIVHPLELDEETLSAWKTHLADNEAAPPFPQLERPVVLVKPEEKKWKTYSGVDGTSINAMTFKGRAERLGWQRASVIDAGGITAYMKCFPSAGVDAFLGLDGMYVGIDMYSSITLQTLRFVKSGSVQIGSYVYDDPADESDPRVMAFGDVPQIVFSEVMGDIAKIAGGKAAAEEEEG